MGTYGRVLLASSRGGFGIGRLRGRLASGFAACFCGGRLGWFRRFFGGFAEERIGRCGGAGLAFLIFLWLLLDDVVDAQVNFAVGGVADDVIPIGKTAVQFLNLIFALLHLLVVFGLLALIFLFDFIAAGFLSFEIFVGVFILRFAIVRRFAGIRLSFVGFRTFGFGVGLAVFRLFIF
jgi:hypothetical protein